MRYEDEPFIKVYTRDTIDFLGLSYEARTLCVYLARYVDRAGILRVGKNGLRGVAVAVRADWDKIAAPLQELIDDGRVRFLPEKGALLIPNHIEMQSASASDPARQRKSRETARALLEAKEEAIPVTLPVTPDVTPSVTKRDNRRDETPDPSSRDVTLSVTSRSDQIRSERGEGPDEVTDKPSGIHELAPVARTSSPPDPMGDYELADQWAAGMFEGCGVRPTVPRKGTFRTLLDAIDTHGPPRGGPDEQRARATWTRAKAKAFGVAHRERTRNVFKFVDWLDSGCRTPESTREERADADAVRPYHAEAKLPPREKPLTAEERAAALASVANIFAPKAVSS
jgi:hypothetical protein